MAPSSGSIAGPNTILNTTVADVLSKYADRLEAASDVDAEVDAIIKESLKAHHKVLFDGNGYSDEWVEEAAKRGLPNIKSTVEAIRSLVAPKNIEVMSKHGVLTDVEMHSRYEVHLENYIKTINIEALTALEMAKRDIIPAVIKYSTSLAESINAIKSTGFDADVTAQGETLTEISKLTASAMKKVKALESAISTACSKEDSYDQAYSYRYDVFEALNSLREDVDKLETLVDSKYWPMPTYTDLLFHV